MTKRDWSGMRESNPRLDLGKVAYYHYTNPAKNEFIFIARRSNPNKFAPASLPQFSRELGARPPNPSLTMGAAQPRRTPQKRAEPNQLPSREWISPPAIAFAARRNGWLSRGRYRRAQTSRRPCSRSLLASDGAFCAGPAACGWTCRDFSFWP